MRKRLKFWLKVAAAFALFGVFMFATFMTADVREAVLGRKFNFEADAIIVLGCRVNGHAPSLTLKYRLDRAVEVYRANPSAAVVVTGGQGGNESAAEADVMREYLLERGVKDEDVIVERLSHNTRQNLANAQALLSERFADLADRNVAVVTNAFHMFRSTRIALNLGYVNVFPATAPNVWWRVPIDYTREFFAFYWHLIRGDLDY